MHGLTRPAHEVIVSSTELTRCLTFDFFTLRIIVQLEKWFDTTHDIHAPTFIRFRNGLSQGEGKTWLTNLRGRHIPTYSSIARSEIELLQHSDENGSSALS